MSIDDIVRQAREEGVIWSLAVKAEVMKSFLRALSQSDFRNDLVLQGGSALRFIYGSPRYSVDIDFVQNDPQQDLACFEKLPEILPYFLGFEVTSAAKRVGPRMLRLSLILKMQTHELLSTKVEIFAVGADGKFSGFTWS